MDFIPRNMQKHFVTGELNFFWQAALAPGEKPAGHARATGLW
jgi:hypothetical protein